MTSVGVVSDNVMGVTLLTSKGSSDVIKSMGGHHRDNGCGFSDITGW